MTIVSSRVLAQVFGLTVVATVCAAAPLRAQTLVAGGSLSPNGTPFAQTFSSLSQFGSLVAATENTYTADNSANPSLNLVVTIRSAAYQDSNGFYSFVYQVANSPSSGQFDAIGRVTASTYSAADGTDFSTNLFYSTADTDGSGIFTAGTVRAENANRTNDGDTVSFGFVDSGTTTKVRPGDTSATLVVQTNARTFTTGPVAVSNGLTINGIGFAPSAPSAFAAPEPGTLTLCGLVLAGAGAFWKRRRRY